MLYLVNIAAHSFNHKQEQRDTQTVQAFLELS